MLIEARTAKQSCLWKNLWRFGYLSGCVVIAYGSLLFFFPRMGTQQKHTAVCSMRNRTPNKQLIDTMEYSANQAAQRNLIRQTVAKLLPECTEP